jgi:anion-transporting  ArsA/GET3 family ATPase
MASRPFYTVADRILGSQFLEDIAEFFLLFQTMYDGFIERSTEVARLLGDPNTTFLVVSTLEPAPVREAEFFIDALRDRQLHLGAVVLNKILPADLFDGASAAVAERLRADAAGVVDAAGVPGDADASARVLTEVAESFLNYRVVASREAEQRGELAAHADLLAAVPAQRGDICDLAGLLEVGDRFWR